MQGRLGVLSAATKTNQCEPGAGCCRIPATPQPGPAFGPGPDHRTPEAGQFHPECAGVLHLRRAALADPVRVPDDPHPVRHHRRPARARDHPARVPAVPVLRARHGADLLPAGRAGRFLPGKPAGRLPERMGNRRVQPGVRPPGSVHVRLL